MNLLDWVLLVILLLSVIPAAVKGFVYEALMMVATIFGIAAGVTYYARVGAYFSRLTSSPVTQHFLGFCAIFLGALLLALIIARLASTLVAAAGLRWFDRFLGAALGLARGVLVGMIVLIMMTAFPFDLPLVQHSLLAGDFLWAGEALVAVLPAELRAQFNQGLEQLRRLPLKTLPVLPGTRPAPPPLKTPPAARPA